MRSRAARLTACAAAWIALAGTGYFLFSSETQLSGRRQSLRTFDQHAREAASALSDMRAAQQAYVAAGQGAAFWMPKVATLQTEMTRWVDDLRSAASSDGARTALMEAAASLTEFGNVDRRARDYVKAGETLMAGDVVFTEGGDTAATAARQVEAARLAEHQAFDAAEAETRGQQTIALAAVAGLSVLIMAALAFAAPGEPRAQASATAGGDARESDLARPTGELMLRDRTGPTPPAPSQAPSGSQSRGSVPLLKAAAELCTEFGRINDPGDLPGLLARAADVLDASGIVVWLGSTAGADLRPVLAHGYPDHVLARMPNVPRSADNAAAAAYRTGKLQIVMRRPGSSNGAVVAPLLSPEGCIGALTAEILSGSETTEGVQALAALIAAQLTGVLVGNASPAAAEPSARIATA